jgi:hypothetical protein
VAKRDILLSTTGRTDVVKTSARNTTLYHRRRKESVTAPTKFLAPRIYPRASAKSLIAS